MGTAKRDNNFTDKQKRGIELSCRSLMKRYPYIYDWELSDDWEQWATNIYVNLYINPSKLVEDVGVPLEPYIERGLSRGEQFKTSSLYVYLDRGDFMSSVRIEFLDSGYYKKKEITKLLNSIYQNLPVDMRVQWTGEFGSHNCDLSVDNFILKLI